MPDTKAEDGLEDYLADIWGQGKRKLSVDVDFRNVALPWQFLEKYHGVRNPLANTYFGPR